ncbi:MAG: ribose transport system permease protein [Thermodesulfobacteriota bacterium]|nr:ribose transport system permease protein [Thermodesulfobacteriota bacterium]
MISQTSTIQFDQKSVHAMNWRLYWERYGVIAAFIIVLILASVMAPNFLSVSNILNVLTTMSFVLFVTYGQTLVILSGGMDLSHGSLVSLTCMASAALVAIGHPWMGLSAGLAVGAFCGLINGAIIGVIRLNPIITTLGMLYMAGGLALYFTDGKSIVGGDPAKVQGFHFLAEGRIFHIPFVIILALVFLLLTHFLLRHTRFGNHIYALGGNEEAAEIAGISYAKMKIIIFTLSGLSCGMAGSLLSARMLSGEPQVGAGTFLLESIGAVVVGGNDIFGGMGNVGRTLIGLMILHFLGNALNLMGISTFTQQIIVGVVVLLFCYLGLVHKK